MKMRHLCYPSIAILLLQAAGCANVVRGTSESVTVESPGCPGATCTLSHKKGSWTVVTPGSIVIPRSDDPLKVSCTKDGEVIAMQADSGVSAGAIVGDALLFGLFSAANAATDAHREYPDRISVPIVCK